MPNPAPGFSSILRSCVTGAIKTKLHSAVMLEKQAVRYSDDAVKYRGEQAGLELILPLIESEFVYLDDISRALHTKVEVLCGYYDRLLIAGQLSSKNEIHSDEKIAAIQWAADFTDQMIARLN